MALVAGLTDHSRRQYRRRNMGQQKGIPCPPPVTVVVAGRIVLGTANFSTEAVAVVAIVVVADVK